MPKALRSTTCKDLFDFYSQKDAICNMCISTMDPLIKQRRKQTKCCERPWDEKWSSNRYDHIVKRYCTAVKYMQGVPDIDMCPGTVCPSIRNITTTTTKTERKEETPLNEDNNDLLIKNTESTNTDANKNSDEVEAAISGLLNLRSMCPSTEKRTEENVPDAMCAQGPKTPSTSSSMTSSENNSSEKISLGSKRPHAVWKIGYCT